ncbi:hypothetical protein [Tamlana flava]|uniref:hypothetical protein n=1 Tax=Tamlana flava TaxID=3158572 RepID=UPI00351B449A
MSHRQNYDIWLQPLRVPEGWQIKYNQLYEVDPVAGNEQYFDSPTLLHLKHHDLKRLIDVSWKPERDLDGSYELLVLNFIEDFNEHTNEMDNSVDWCQPYATYSFKTRKELVETLEQLLVQLPAFEDPRILKKRGVVDEPSETYRIQLLEHAITDNLVKNVVTHGNTRIQNMLLDHKDMSLELLSFVLENTQRKGVKNKAKQMLDSKRFNS